MAPKAPPPSPELLPHSPGDGQEKKETSLMVINILLQQMLSVQQSQSKYPFIFQQCCWVMRPRAGFSCCHQVQRSSEATAQAGNAMSFTQPQLQRATQQPWVPGLAGIMAAEVTQLM